MVRLYYDFPMRRIVFSLIASTSCLLSCPGTGYTALKAIYCYLPETSKEEAEKKFKTAWTDGSHSVLKIFDESTEEVYSFNNKAKIFKKLPFFVESREDGYHAIDYISLMRSGSMITYTTSSWEKNEPDGIINTFYYSYLINLDTMKAKSREHFFDSADVIELDSDNRQCVDVPLPRKYSIER